MDRNTKLQWREQVVEAINKSQAVILTNYAGMTVENLTILRRELKAVNAQFRVVKNTVAKKAVQTRSEAGLTDILKGQTGIVFAYGDVAAAAKIVSEATKKFEKLKILGAYTEQSILNPQAVEKLASLPSRQVLLGQIIGSMVAPQRALLGVLSGVQRNLVQVLNAIKDQKASA